MKSNNIWRYLVALAIISVMSINVYADNNSSTTQTTESNQEVQTEEEEPVEIDPTVVPFSVDWWIIILGN